MSVQATPFGTIAFPAKISKKRRAAILRALAWCEQLAKESGMWDAQQSTYGGRLVRIVNGHELAVFPMAAANLDAGCSVGSRFQARHLPVEVNGIRVCVVPEPGSTSRLHTDFVACFLLLCGSEEIPIQHLPHTLKKSLYPEKYLGQGHARLNPVLDRRRRDLHTAFLNCIRVPEDAVEHALTPLRLMTGRSCETPSGGRFIPRQPAPLLNEFSGSIPCEMSTMSFGPLHRRGRTMTRTSFK